MCQITTVHKVNNTQLLGDPLSKSRQEGRQYCCETVVLLPQSVNMQVTTEHGSDVADEAQSIQHRQEV